MLKSSLLILIACLVKNGLPQDQSSKRLVCQLVDDDDKETIQIDDKDSDGLKIIPFKFEAAADTFQSVLPFLKNLPKVDSPDQLPPLSIKGTNKELSITCDAVSDGTSAQIKDLKDEVSRLSKIVEKLEEQSACLGGVIFGDVCFRLMEVRNKKFFHEKAEDLCNANGGILASFGSAEMFIKVSAYVQKKFEEPPYDEDTELTVWTNMKYPMATSKGNNPFFFPVLSGKIKEERAALDKIVSWMDGYPKDIMANTRIAIQFRKQLGLQNFTINQSGAINVWKRQRFTPLCQFHITEQKDERSVSKRFFRFGF